MEDNNLLDVKAVAALLDCSPNLVWKMRNIGRLPQSLKIGTLVRWSKQSILDWIAAETGSEQARTAAVG